VYDVRSTDGAAPLPASQFMLGALIAFMSVLIVLALATGRVVFAMTPAGVRYMERSEDPVFFWLAIASWACALGIAVWTALGKKFY
jgi:hypothetical protein